MLYLCLISFYKFNLPFCHGASSFYNRSFSAVSFCFYSHYIIHLSCKAWLYFLQEGLRRTIESYPHLRAEHGSAKDGSSKSSASLFKRFFLMVIINTYTLSCGSKKLIKTPYYLISEANAKPWSFSHMVMNWVDLPTLIKYIFLV